MCARLIELKINGKLYPNTTGIISTFLIFSVGQLGRKMALVFRDMSGFTI